MTTLFTWYDWARVGKNLTSQLHPLHIKMLRKYGIMVIGKAWDRYQAH
jgi:hypothetical protein